MFGFPFLSSNLHTHTHTHTRTYIHNIYFLLVFRYLIYHPKLTEETNKDDTEHVHRKKKRERKRERIERAHIFQD